MKFKATIERYVNDEYVEREVEFDNIKEYRVDEYFLILIAEDGTHHATKATKILKFTFTN